LSPYEGVGVGVLKIEESESEVLKIEESELESEVLKIEESESEVLKIEESESEVLKIEESESKSELLCTDSTAVVKSINMSRAYSSYIIHC
jgi:hypothetical protein